MLGIEQYLEKLYEQTVNKQVRSYDLAWKMNLRARFQERLGEFSFSENQLLNPIVTEKVEKEDYIRLKVEITTIATLRLPMYILVPKKNEKTKLPAVLALHGHGYGHREVVGLNHDGSENNEGKGIHKNLAVELVQKGMIVVAPEIIGFGDRKLTKEQNPTNPSSNSCFSIASSLLLMGKTLAGLRVYESQRVLDYVMTMDKVDSKQIGCFGFSGGGLVAAFTSIMDERINATVITGYTNTFKGSIMDRHHCLDNYIPGVLQLAEMPELIGLIAPNPLFIEAGIEDHLFPLQEVKSAMTTIHKVYQAFEAVDSLHHHYFDGKHEISGQKSFDWLYKTLQNK